LQIGICLGEKSGINFMLVVYYNLPWNRERQM